MDTAAHVAHLHAQGMQINPGVPTIEAALRDALVAAGGISRDNADKLTALRWSRAARTDKGVSALGQVVGVKLMHPEGLLERLRGALPPKIRMLGVKCAAELGLLLTCAAVLLVRKRRCVSGAASAVRHFFMSPPLC
jgi:hypothetical protein